MKSRMAWPVLVRSRVLDAPSRPPSAWRGLARRSFSSPGGPWPSTRFRLYLRPSTAWLVAPPARVSARGERPVAPPLLPPLLPPKPVSENRLVPKPCRSPDVLLAPPHMTDRRSLALTLLFTALTPTAKNGTHPRACSSSSSREGGLSAQREVSGNEVESAREAARAQAALFAQGFVFAGESFTGAPLVRAPFTGASVDEGRAS